MSQTRIEWVRKSNGKAGHTWNPVVGCKRRCPYCYALAMFGDAFDEPKFHPERLIQPAQLKKPSTVFVGSVCDLFARWTQDEWIAQTLEAARNAPQHRYIFLTKSPENYLRWLDKLPDGTWIGTTIESQTEDERWNMMPNYPRRFVSIEPMLGPVYIRQLRPLPDWVIVGGRSEGKGRWKTPDPKWTMPIIYYCTANGIPLFLKNNAFTPKAIRNGAFNQSFLRQIPWIVPVDKSKPEITDPPPNRQAKLGLF